MVGPGPWPNGQKQRITVVATLCVLVCSLVFYFHAAVHTGVVVTHSFYVPIILAALWWGRRGLVVTVSLAALLMLSHAFLESGVPIALDCLRAVMLVAVGCIVAELAERAHKAQAALRESETRLRGFAESAPDAFMLFDSALNLVEINSAVLGFHPPGTKKEDIVGKQLTEIVPDIKETGRHYRYMEIVATGKRYFADDVVPHPKFGDRHLTVRAFKVGAGLGIIATDITERKRAQEEAAKARAYLESALANIPDGVVFLDRRRRFSYVNPGFLRLVGREAEEFIGRTIREAAPSTMNAETVETISEGVQRRLTDGEPISGAEMELVDKDGEPMSISYSAAAIKDGKGTVLGEVIFLRDITERKRAEEKLRTCQAMVESAQDAIFFKDLESRYVLANAKTSEAFGASREEVLGKTDFELMPDKEEARKNVENDQHVFGTGEKVAITKHMTSADGTERWFEAIKVPQVDDNGRIRGLVGIARDITNRKHAEDALRDSERRFRELAELLPGIVFETDERGFLTYINRQALAATGYTRQDLEKGFRAVNLLTPADREGATRSILDLMSSKLEGTGEYTILRKDGTTFPVLSRSVPIMRGGRPVGLRGILLDIAEQKRLKGQLRQTRKMEAIGELAGGIAHDFNNLLTGILGYANLMKLKARPRDDIFRAADVIERAATRAAELTNQLLGFARMGKMQNVPVNVHGVVGEVVAILDRTIDKRIGITQRFKTKRRLVMGDPSQIQQVVMNLAVNARDAMPDGGELVFETSVVDLDEEYCRTHAEASPGRYLLLSVADTGVGIPEDIRERIFEPFFTTKPEGEGSGMGLAMVYGIVKNHGGHVGVYSEAGRGTTLKAYLPLAEEALPPATGAEEGKPVPGTGRILVVDDEETVREVLQEMLTSLGYEVTAVHNGREAVEHYKQHGREIDLVILDMTMPFMSGGECFRALREIDPGIKGLLSTGHAMNGAAQKLLDEGMLGFVQKPYVVAEMSRAVAEALRGWGETNSGLRRSREAPI